MYPIIMPVSRTYQRFMEAPGLREVTVSCDRCHRDVKGLESNTATAGFYRVQEGSPWNAFANAGEQVLCDSCVWADERYQVKYGPPCQEFAQVKDQS